MRRFVLATLAVLAVAATSVVGFALAGPVAGQGGAKAGAVTNVTVRGGEYYFTLSQTTVPTGTVNFTFINEGDQDHDFAINGKKTPILTQKGQSATISVDFTRASNYGFVCTVGEHAVYGMAGNLTVVQDPNATTATTTTTTTTTPPPPPFKGTTLRVALSDFKIKITTTRGKRVTRIKRGNGKFRFQVTNVGKAPHDFKIQGKKTPLLLNGGKATLTVTLGKGKRPYLCTLAGHAALGMKGTLTVT